jgi:hypothetical protein
MLLGVSLMGERTPFLQEQQGHSLIIEQHLDEISQFQVAGHRSQAESIAPEPGSAEAISVIGLSERSLRRRKGSHISQKSRRSNKSDRSYQSDNKAIPNFSMTKQQGKPRCAFPTWRKAFSHEYLTECSLGTLETLVCSWNHEHNGCCNWHASLDQLADLVSYMRRWRMCHEVWPTCTPLWQCRECSALQFTDAEDFCSLCFATIE